SGGRGGGRQGWGFLQTSPSQPGVNQSRLASRKRRSVALPRQAQRAAKPLRQHDLQPRAQRRIELRHAGLENDRLGRQTLFVLADHKQHPRRAREGRRDHGGLARNRVTKSTFVVLISIVNATSDQSGGRRLKKMTCVYFATLLSIRKAWQRAAAGVAAGARIVHRGPRRAPPAWSGVGCTTGFSLGTFERWLQKNFGVIRTLRVFATRDTSSPEDLECRTTLKQAKVEVG